MGRITLNTLQLGSTLTGNLSVKVEYRIASSTGEFSLVTNNAIVSPDGNSTAGIFSPAVQITGLTNGTEYTVKVTLNCSGASAVINIVAGVSCQSFTLQGGVQGGSIEWQDCGSGVTQNAFVPFNTQKIICARAGYTILYGAIDEISRNGACIT